MPDTLTNQGAIVDLVFVHGASFTRTGQLTEEDGTPIDLTDATLSAQVLDADGEVLIDWDCTIIDEEDGTYRIHVSRAQIESVAPGTKCSWGYYVEFPTETLEIYRGTVTVRKKRRDP